MQEMKDYLHNFFTRMSVAGKRGRHSGIEVMSLKVAFMIYKNRGSDSRWVTREIVIFLLGVVTIKKGYGEMMQVWHGAVQVFNTQAQIHLLVEN